MSNWDFGRQPADHLDAGSFRDSDRAYPMGGVQWTGNRDWTNAGFDGFDASGGVSGVSAPDGFGGQGELDDLDAAPYPLTYERGLDDRGLDELDEPRPPASQYEPYAPWPPAQPPDDRFAPEDRPAPAALAAPPAYTADGEFATAQFAAPYVADLYASDEPWLRTPAPAGRPGPGPSGDWPGGPSWPAQPGPGTAPSRRWLMYAGVAVAAAAIGGAAVLLNGGHPRSQAAGTTGTMTTPPAAAKTASRSAAPRASATRKATVAPAAPLTMTQAQGVLAQYTAVNNNANAKRDDAQLASIEMGSSYAIDSGLYLMQGAAGVAPYPAFAPVSSTFYVPAGEPAGGPRWFVVRVSNAFTSSPKRVQSTEYLLFSQSAAGGQWKNAIEPYVFSGANVPQPALGADGLATAVAATATSLATAPDQLPTLTATSLNGTGAVANPGNLQDGSDQRTWQGKLPSATVTDTHALVTGDAGETFALRTTGGGALVFYTDAATLTITPPSGSVLHLTIPGLYSSAQSLSRAGLSYLDQFATYDPPAGSGTPSIIADYSGITGKA